MAKPTDALEQTADLTRRMKKHQRKINDLSLERQDAVINAREEGHTFRAIAETMGVTEQVVYKIVREWKSQRTPNREKASS